MDRGFRRGFTAAEKTELWDRWQRGESLKAIGRVIETLKGELMTGFSEQDSIDPDNPKRDYMTLSERAAKLGPLVSQGAMPEPTSSILSPALLAPKAIDQPARRTRDLDRRAALLSVATAIAGIVSVAALLFATTKPASRQSVVTSIPSEITGSVPQTTQGDVESKPAPAELKAPNTLPASQLDEQSQQLLQRFLQWREKAAPKGGG